MMFSLKLFSVQSTLVLRLLHCLHLAQVCCLEFEVLTLKCSGGFNMDRQGVADAMKAAFEIQFNFGSLTVSS